MQHPFINLDDIATLKIEELQEKIADLNKKLNFAYRMQNQAMINQLRMVIESYNSQYQSKISEQYKKMNLNDKINISSDTDLPKFF